MPITTQIHGHRGSRTPHPENTLPAIAHALNQGADGIEVDLQICRDHTIIIHHDPHLPPNLPHTPTRIPIRTLTYPDLQKTLTARAIPPDHLPPTLPQLLHYMHHPTRHHATLNIEIKPHPHLPPPLVIDLLIHDLQTAQTTQPPPSTTPSPPPSLKLLIQSFDHTLIHHLNKTQTHPNWQTALTHNRPPNRQPYTDHHLNQTLAAQAQIISLDHRALTPTLLTRAHHLNLKTCIWTVNTKKSIHQILNLNPHILTTDYPARAIHIKKTLNAEPSQ